jgi:hypothetical protein
MSIQKYVDCMHKDEIIYELDLLDISTDVNATTDAVRKQIRQVFKIMRRGSIKCGQLKSPVTTTEIEICTPKVELLENQLRSGNVDDANLVRKITRRANYLIDRLARISEPSAQLSDLRSRLVRILSEIDNGQGDSNSEYEESQAPPSVEKEESKVFFIKDRPVNLNSLNLKFDGTTCVRVFIERLEELRQARNISEEHILSAFSDLLESSALHWFRSNKSSIFTYKQLLKNLKNDFDIPDLDYKLLGEIRQRTQAKNETIVVYLSTMQGMFSRLTYSLSEREQLEILMHNIRPEYMKELALHDINTIDRLKFYCKQLELARSRADHFIEPAFNNFKITSDLHHKSTSKSVGKQVSALNEPSSSRQGDRMDSTDRRNMKCFRCNADTHFTNQCKSRELVCFKCGMKGVKRSNCTNCNGSKN